MTAPAQRSEFSIVISVLNAASTLGQCLDSVLAQTFTAWELIVIDGGSTDGTQVVVERYGSSIAYFESERDRGICHAWNKAVRQVRGDWVLFLGADDRLASRGVLEQVYGVLPPAKEARVAYGMVDVADPSGRTISRMGDPWESAGPLFFHHNTLPHQGVFHHRTLFEANGPFDEQYRICGDYELLLRELRVHAPRYMPGIVVAEMGGGGISNRPASQLLATREFHRAQLKHGLTTVPEWRSARILRARIYDRLRRAFGPRVARVVADVYHSITVGPRR